VQKALADAGIAYEVVKQPIHKSNRAELMQRSDQQLLPAIEFEDESIQREESADVVALIRDGRQQATAQSSTRAGWLARPARPHSAGSPTGPPPSDS
jgi:hypothetical protein